MHADKLTLETRTVVLKLPQLRACVAGIGTQSTTIQGMVFKSDY